MKLSEHKIALSCGGFVLLAVTSVYAIAFLWIHNEYSPRRQFLIELPFVESPSGLEASMRFAVREGPYVFFLRIADSERLMDMHPLKLVLEYRIEFGNTIEEGSEQVPINRDELEENTHSWILERQDSNVLPTPWTNYTDVEKGSALIPILPNMGALTDGTRGTVTVTITNPDMFPAELGQLHLRMERFVDAI